MTRVSDDKKMGKNFFDNDELNSSKHDDILVWLHKKIKDGLLADFLNENYDYSKILKIEIEKPILRKDFKYNDYVAGFADLHVEFEAIRKDAVGKVTKYSNGEETIDDGKRPINWFFEIKTSLNIGETIRQIKYYNYDSSQTWFVCSPDSSKKNLLFENGISFISYEP